MSQCKECLRRRIAHRFRQRKADARRRKLKGTRSGPTTEKSAGNIGNCCSKCGQPGHYKPTCPA